MKGVIFVHFIEHLESRIGLDKTDEIFNAIGSKLSTGGSYTTVGNYPHQELLDLAVAVSTTFGTPLEILIREFALYLMQEFKRMHAPFFEQSQDIFAFLGSLEPLIHTDVRKLYPDARPPLVVTEPCIDGSINLRYSSSRPFAQIALELTRAAGEVMAQPLILQELERSEDQCTLTLNVRKQHG